MAAPAQPGGATAHAWDLGAGLGGGARAWGERDCTGSRDGHREQEPRCGWGYWEEAILHWCRTGQEGSCTGRCGVGELCTVGGEVSNASVGSMAGGAGGRVGRSFLLRKRLWVVGGHDR